jgi:hypothetical protein
VIVEDVHGCDSFTSESHSAPCPRSFGAVCDDHAHRTWRTSPPDEGARRREPQRALAVMAIAGGDFRSAGDPAAVWGTTVLKARVPVVSASFRCRIRRVHIGMRSGTTRVFGPGRRADPSPRPRKANRSTTACEQPEGRASASCGVSAQVGLAELLAARVAYSLLRQPCSLEGDQPFDR